VWRGTVWLTTRYSSHPLKTFDGLTVSSAAALLLDDYPGAIGAWSLRRLNTNYTGECVRVRRASDNTEQTIGFDTNGVIDESALSTFCGSSDGYVRTLYGQDASGGTGVGNDATRSTATQQPKIYDGTTGTVEENGKPTMYFAGGDFLNHELGLTGGYSTNHGIFGVGRVVTANSYALWFAAGNNADNINGTCIISKTSGIYWGTYDGGDIVANTSILDSTQHLLVMHRSTTGSGTFRLDGSTDGTYSGTSGSTTKSIGHANAKDNIQEVVFYNSEPSSSDISGIEANIDAFYAIPGM
jgi:hypothetical protein